MATHQQPQQQHLHHQQHRSSSCSSTSSPSDLDITTSDHFYLSPKFYESNVVVVTDGGDQSRKENSPATINGKTTRASATAPGSNDAVVSVQRKLFANEVQDDFVQNNTAPALGNAKHQDCNNSANDAEVMLEQDPNSGCFNNNNNNSVKRHLVTLNGPSLNGNKPKLNGTPVALEDTQATSFTSPAPTAISNSSYKKDLTPRQVCVFLNIFPC